MRLITSREPINRLPHSRMQRKKSANSLLPQLFQKPSMNIRSTLDSAVQTAGTKQNRIAKTLCMAVILVSVGLLFGNNSFGQCTTNTITYSGGQGSNYN